jgi:transposase-like protein
MTEYSDGFRARMVERMTGARRMSANALAQEVGINQPTLSRWLRDAATVGDVSKKKAKAKRSQPEGRRPSEWSAEEKVRVVMAAATIAETELGPFLRREGLHEEDLARLRDEVRNAAVAGLTASKKPRSDEQKRIKDLERELKRKEAALAETAALLVLRKKAGALWGGEGEDT